MYNVLATCPERIYSHPYGKITSYTTFATIISAKLHVQVYWMGVWMDVTYMLAGDITQLQRIEWKFWTTLLRILNGSMNW